MRAYLISDGTRPGSSALARDLATIFDLEVIAPVFVSAAEVENKNVVNAAAFFAFHLRQPTRGEIGCALAHRHAQQDLARSGSAIAAIFEDDARIDDLACLSSRIKIYEQMCQQIGPALINLNRNAIPKHLERTGADYLGLSRALTPPYPATAYVLNRAAAKAFITSQTPIRSQADWPRTTTDVSYFVDRRSCVYEDLGLASTIDVQGLRQQIPANRKIRMWSGLWFFQHREFFPSFRHYWTWHIFARILHHADSASGKLSQSPPK